MEVMNVGSRMIYLSLRGTRRQSLLRHGHSSNALPVFVIRFARNVNVPPGASGEASAARSLHRLRGDKGIRTLDPLLAGQVLSQLSYTPLGVWA